MLRLEDVDISYGPIPALKEISLAIPQGQVVALLGPNGAGKTTLLRTISGILRPQKGTISFEGRRIERARTDKIVSAGIVQVPEGRQLFADLSVLENLKMGGFLLRERDLQKDFHQVFSYFPVLRERLAQAAGTLSGGEMQMLAIGRALVARPRLLLLDEPSLGLAPVIVQKLFTVIKDLNQRQGLTVLLAEQNAHLSLGISHYAYVLETGKLALSGTPGELRRNEAVQQLYLGTKTVVSHNKDRQIAASIRPLANVEEVRGEDRSDEDTH
ncbi:ABC transporter ATP-binding protein [Candidatus Acetothermia bacterium]|nr:ABC transporter ATP-binding protein [Candidatus Acetothermia bacterium]